MGLKVREEPEEAELWFFSFADLMCLLMGYFVLLYSMATPDETKFNAMAKAIAESLGIPTAEIVSQSTTSGPSEQNRQMRAFQMLIAILNLGDETKAVKKVEQIYAAKVGENLSKSEIANQDLQDLKVQLLKQDIEKPELIFEIVIPSDRLFLNDSAQVQHTATQSLKRIAQTILKTSIPIEVEIIAHTNSKPPPKQSGFSSNGEFSSQQATNLARQFANFGVSTSQISIKGMGSLSPIIPEFDRNGRPIMEAMKQNQRVHIAVRKMTSP